MSVPSRSARRPLNPYSLAVVQEDVERLHDLLTPLLVPTWGWAHAQQRWRRWRARHDLTQALNRAVFIPGFPDALIDRLLHLVGPSRRDVDGQTPLTESLVAGRQGLTLRMLATANPRRKSRTSLNELRSFGRRAITNTAQDPAVREKLPWEAPLVVASAHGHPWAVNALLPGYPRNHREVRRALDEALAHDHPEVVRRLMAHLDRPPNHLWFIAAQHNALNCVELLQEHRSPNAVNAQGDTPLMVAARQGHTTFVEHLLPLVDASCRNKHGETALHNAALSGSETCVVALLPVSDPCAQDHNGYTPLMNAVERCGQHRPEVVQHLIPVSDPWQKNRRGYRALDLIVRRHRSHDNMEKRQRVIDQITRWETFRRETVELTAAANLPTCESRPRARL